MAASTRMSSSSPLSRFRVLSYDRPVSHAPPEPGPVPGFPTTDDSTRTRGNGRCRVFRTRPVGTARGGISDHGRRLPAPGTSGPGFPTTDAICPQGRRAQRIALQRSTNSRYHSTEGRRVVVRDSPIAESVLDVPHRLLGVLEDAFRGHQHDAPPHRLELCPTSDVRVPLPGALGVLTTLRTRWRAGCRRSSGRSGTPSCRRRRAGSCSLRGSGSRARTISIRSRVSITESTPSRTRPAARRARRQPAPPRSPLRRSAPAASPGPRRRENHRPRRDRPELRPSPASWRNTRVGGARGIPFLTTGTRPGSDRCARIPRRSVLDSAPGMLMWVSVDSGAQPPHSRAAVWWLT